MPACMERAVHVAGDAGRSSRASAGAQPVASGERTRNAARSYDWAVHEDGRHIRRSDVLTRCDGTGVGGCSGSCRRSEPPALTRIKALHPELASDSECRVVTAPSWWVTGPGPRLPGSPLETASRPTRYSRPSTRQPPAGRPWPLTSEMPGRSWFWQRAGRLTLAAVRSTELRSPVVLRHPSRWLSGYLLAPQSPTRADSQTAGWITDEVGVSDGRQDATARPALTAQRPCFSRCLCGRTVDWGASPGRRRLRARSCSCAADLARPRLAAGHQHRVTSGRRARRPAVAVIRRHPPSSPIPRWPAPSFSGTASYDRASLLDAWSPSRRPGRVARAHRAAAPGHRDSGAADGRWRLPAGRPLVLGVLARLAFALIGSRDLAARLVICGLALGIGSGSPQTSPSQPDRGVVARRGDRAGRHAPR